MTVDINPDAVWEDGTPITWADFECTWQAQPEHARLARAPPATTRSPVDRRRERQAGRHHFTRCTRRTRRSSTRSSRRPRVADCKDISTDFETEMPISARPYMISSCRARPELDLRAEPELVGRCARSPSESSWSPLRRHRHRDRRAQGRRGRLHLPAVLRWHRRRARRPEHRARPVDFGGDYEGCTSSSEERRPVRRPDLPQGASSGRSTVKRCSQQIYVPLVEGAEMLQCGPIVPGPYCDDDAFGRRHLRPGGRGADADRRRLDEERRRLLGRRRRQRPGDPLDGQHRQHPS